MINLELFQPVDLTMTNLKIVKRGKNLPPKTMEVVLKKWQLSIFLLHVTQRQIRNQETTVKKKVNYINCCVLQLRIPISEESPHSTRVTIIFHEFDFANQLLTRHLPLALISQVNE